MNTYNPGWKVSQSIYKTTPSMHRTTLKIVKAVLLLLPHTLFQIIFEKAIHIKSSALRAAQGANKAQQTANVLLEHPVVPDLCFQLGFPFATPNFGFSPCLGGGNTLRPHHFWECLVFPLHQRTLTQGEKLGNFLFA